MDRRDSLSTITIISKPRDRTQVAVYVMRPVDSPTWVGASPTYTMWASDDPVYKAEAASEAEDPTSFKAFLRQSRSGGAAHPAGWSLSSHGAVAAAAPLEELAEVYSVAAARPGSADSAGVVLAGLAAVAAVAVVAAVAGRRRRGYVSLSKDTSGPYGSC